MILSSSMGGDAAPPPPATQDSTGVVHISRRRKQLKVPPEALAKFLGQQLSIWNHHEKCPVQEQMTKVALEALAKFAAQPVIMRITKYKNK
jgi:adenine C2-methylase RlmN of 23S rRNA A2503 and tRNA A37